MEFLQKAQNWLWSIALKKVAVKLAQIVAAAVVSNAAKAGAFGISIDVNPDMLALGLVGASELARNWLKFHFPALDKVL